VNKRPLSQILLFFILSLSGAYHIRYVLWSVLACTVIYFAMLIEHCWKRRYKILIVKSLCILVTILIGIFVATMQKQKNLTEQASFPDKTKVNFSGKVIKKEQKNENYYYYLKDCLILKGNQSHSYSQIIIVLNQDKIQIGKQIFGNAFVNQFMQSRNEGNFDEGNYYKSLGISLRLRDVTVVKSSKKSNVYAEKLYHLREKLKHIYESSMPKKEAGVLTIMALGDKSLLDNDVKSIYQKTGISHILSISGLHVSIVGIGIFGILRKKGMSYWSAGIISFSLVFSFGIMSGFGTASNRAILMFFLSIVGKTIGRTYDSVTALVLSAAIALGMEPYLLDYSGFLFTYIAVAGVIIVGGEMAKCFGNCNKVMDTILISAAAQLTTLPLVAFFSYELPVYSIPINLIILPFMEAILCLGFLGGFVGMICPILGKLVLWFVYFILHGYEWVGKLFLNLPYSTYVLGKPTVTKLLLYFMILIVGIYILRFIPKKKSVCLLCAVCLCFLLKKEANHFEIDVLDVGQGDGIFLSTQQGTSIFIDGGSSNVKEVGTYRILPFLKSKGAGKIDYWFLSHGDSDHVSGLLEIMEAKYPVKTIFISEKFIQDEAYDQILTSAKKNHTKISIMQKGDVLKEKELTIKAVFPDKTYDKQDRNAQSMVLLLEYKKFKALFTGDISSEEESRMLGKEKIEKISFYKAAHHGSNYSNSLPFLQKLDPAVAAISCSETNRYGHPGKDTLQRLKQENVKTYFTMKQGQIKLYFERPEVKKKDADIFYVWNYLNPLEVYFYPVIK